LAFKRTENVLERSACWRQPCGADTIL